MGVCCCSSRIGQIYPIEESLVNAMVEFKIRKYNIEELKEKLKTIFEKYHNENDVKRELRELFLDNNFETNKNYVIQNSIFDLYMKFVQRLNIKHILILVFPLLTNQQENALESSSSHFLIIQ